MSSPLSVAITGRGRVWGHIRPHAAYAAVPLHTQALHQLHYGIYVFVGVGVRLQQVHGNEVDSGVAPGVPDVNVGNGSLAASFYGEDGRPVAGEVEVAAGISQRRQVAGVYVPFQPFKRNAR